MFEVFHLIDRRECFIIRNQQWKWELPWSDIFSSEKNISIKIRNWKKPRGLQNKAPSFLQSDTGISTSSLINIGPNLCRKVDTYGITNIKTYGLILIRLSQAPEFKFHSVSYTLISSKLFLVHAYSYWQGVNMKEI